MNPEDLKWIYDNILYINFAQTADYYTVGCDIKITYVISTYFHTKIIGNGNLPKKTCNYYAELIDELLKK